MGALLVPQTRGYGATGSYQADVVGPDGKIAIRPVKVGDRIGTNVDHRGWLKAGERVVAEGQQTLPPCMIVRSQAICDQLSDTVQLTETD